MPVVKTAISMEKELYRQMALVAKRRKIPRSQLISQAVRELIQRDRGEDLTAAINRSLAKVKETPEEKSFLKAAAASMARRLKHKW